MRVNALKTNYIKSVVIFILFTRNNTFFSISEINGQVLFSSSVGNRRIKGLKKFNMATIHELFIILSDFLNQLGYKLVHLKLKGFNKTKRFVIQLLRRSDLQIVTLCDITSKPHNGCRPKNRRRL